MLCAPRNRGQPHSSRHQFCMRTICRNRPLENPGYSVFDATFLTTFQHLNHL